MDVTIRLFGILREAARTASTQVDLPAPAPLGELLSTLAPRFPGLDLRALASEGRLLLAVNREYATAEATVRPGDEVALMPPVAGGSGAPRARPADGTLPPAAADGAVLGSTAGAPQEPREVVDLATVGLDALEAPQRADPSRLLAVVLLSGGIDSPVALYEVLEEGWDAVALHMDNRPFTDDMYVEKVKRHVARVEQVTGRTVPLYLAPHGVNQVTIARGLPERSLQCVVCKRQMYRTAEALARKLGAHAIVTGESLGQVASQTLHNLQVEDQAVSFPFVRPLLGLDKEEIIAIAQRIGTFEISAIPSLCCTILPDRPATHATLDRVLPLEERIGPSGLLQVSTAGLKRIR